MSSEPTVYVVDDDPSVLDSLESLLDSVGIAVRTYESGRAFLEGCQPCGPGCVVTDERMPEMSGLALQKEMIRQGITLPVIVMSAFAEVQMARHALKSGAVDFIEKPFSAVDMLDIIRDALARSEVACEEHAARATFDCGLASLTARERQVLEHLLEGEANKVVAAELGISERTVEVHRRRVMLKMKVHSIVRLAQLASRFMADAA